MADPRHTHPLMPGIRSAEINRPDWPRTLHDGQLTGFSPLLLGMATAPRLWRSIDVPGTYHWIETVQTPDGPGFLLEDGRLSFYEARRGERRWQAEAAGRLVFWGDLYGDGSRCALLQRGNRLTVIDGLSGKMRWARAYEPAHVELRLQVAPILSSGGLQVAIFEQYGEDGWLLSFEPDGAVRQVWRRRVLANDVWPTRADHGCDIAFDLKSAAPVLWNVRHHRVQSFDAASGEPLGCLQYELDGAYRRNYGPWRLAQAGGESFIVVAAEMVQTHVHGIRLRQDGAPELAWQRYYGEVYVEPGVAVEFLGVGDLDGDGNDEIAYNVRDPQDGFRSFVRARDVATGAVKYELPDSWCSALARDVGPQGRSFLVVHPASKAPMPRQGPLRLIELVGGSPEVQASFDHGGPWGTVCLPAPAGNDLLLRLVEDGRPCLLRLDGSDLEPREKLDQGPLLDEKPVAAARTDAGLHLASAAGVCTWPPTGDQAPPQPFQLRGGPSPTLSAAGDSGEAVRLYAHVPGHRLQAWRLDSDAPRQTLDVPFLGETARHSPLLYDLDGDGRLEAVVPGETACGELDVRALRPDGTPLWHAVLPEARSDDDGRASAWNAGRFLLSREGPQAGLALSVYSLRRSLEGTYMLEGDSGRVRWFRGTYRDGDTIRAYRPVGLPGVFDWDGDGAEEIVWDMYSYLAFMRGDGELAAAYGGENVRPAAEAVPAVMLYNGFTPVYRSPDDARPHWLVHHGHGRFGLVGPDPRRGLWHEDVGYDTPERLGFVDVDGDGVLEVGYALNNSVTFRCRDLWSGETKWSLDLPEPPTGPVLSADVDGDGKGEFLVDRWCLGTDSAGRGQIRWQAPVSLGWAVIADFDGDGKGEIACPAPGAIHVLKGDSGDAA